MPLDFKLHYVCPRCGRKLSKVDAMEYATLNLRRKCQGCHRRFMLIVTPIKIASGWMHNSVIQEVEPRIREVLG